MHQNLGFLTMINIVYRGNIPKIGYAARGEKSRVFVKFRHLVGILYYGIGKIAQKKRVFGIFDPNNRIGKKIPAYHVGNFLISFFKSIFFR